MQFRLIYQGKLPAASRTTTRAEEKQAIRKVFHKQLRELWRTHPELRGVLTWHTAAVKDEGSFIESVANNHAICGYRFVPLIGDSLLGDLACALDILFLRRDQPGNLIEHGGDVDNRIKVIFDALRMPQSGYETCGQSPEADEDPFFCLLRDDSLITEVKVTTDRLLTPIRDEEHVHDVHLIIHVRTLVIGSKVPAGLITAFLS